MSEWAGYCSDEGRDLVRRAVAFLDAGGMLTMTESADELRRMSRVARAGELGVVVGPVESGVSDINLAAAIVEGGRARDVVLVCREATGSLRSRARQAGIDRVIEEGELPARETLPGAQPAEATGVGEASPVFAASFSAACDSGELPGEGAPLLTLCSGRGGVGKTTLAVCLSAVAARWGLRVCLLDLDLSCGNAASCFGLATGSDLAALAQDAAPAVLSRSAVSAAPGVSLMGPCERPETAELVAGYMAGLLDWATREFDLVVADTSTTFTDAVAQAAQRADRLLLVSDGRPGALSSVARMGGLAVRLGVARTRVARVENRSDARSGQSAAEKGAEAGLEAARVYRVLEEDEVEGLLASGRAVELCEPGYPFSDSVASMLAQLLAELGKLPEHEEARHAYGLSQRGRRRGLFGRRREAR